MSHPFAEQGTTAFCALGALASGEETVGRIDDWADGQVKEVKVHKKPMTVGRIGEKFFAVNSICPHMGGPLSCGKLDEGKIHCPWHAWSFNVDTGKSANGHTIDRYQVRVENGEVKVGWIINGEI